MKKVVAYRCDFCGRYRLSRSHLKEHENKCFKNPASKSCITCAHLNQKMFLDGRLLTEEEHKILSFGVEGTFETYGDPDGSDYNVLNFEHQYLYDASPESFCDASKKILGKLKTNCTLYV